MSRSLATKNIPVLPLKTFKKIYEEKQQPIIKLLGDCDYHITIAGQTGSGKDSLMQSIIDIDMKEGRTPIIFDTKLEYPSLIFMQQDPILAEKLREMEMLPTSYRVNLWIPYTQGLEKDKHFKKLLRCVHPKLRIRPFRILLDDLKSQDTRSWMLGMTQSQSLATTKELKGQLAGVSKKSQEFKDNVGKQVLIIDEFNMHKNKDKPWLDGWEYMDFEELTNHNCVQIIGFSYMRPKNRLVGASTGIGLWVELLTRAYNPRNNVFSIYCPELKLWLPNVPQLDNQVKSLKFAIEEGMLVGRSFHCLFRINLQNLNSLDSNSYSQSRILSGRTESQKDIRTYRQDFRVPEHNLQKLIHAKTGTYYDLRTGTFFSLVPRAHKARKREFFSTKMYPRFRKNPENYLFDYKYCYVSDILTNFWQKGSLNVKDYRILSKRYFNNLQRAHHHKIMPLDYKENAETKTMKTRNVQKEEMSVHG